MQPIYTLYSTYMHLIFNLYTPYIQPIYTLYATYIHFIVNLYSLYTPYLQPIFTYVNLIVNLFSPIYTLYTTYIRHMLTIFNNYPSSPNGLWVNSPWGRRPHGLLTQRPCKLYTVKSGIRHNKRLHYTPLVPLIVPLLVRSPLSYHLSKMQIKSHFDSSVKLISHLIILWINSPWGRRILLSTQGQERIKGTHKASSVHTLFHR